MYMTKKSTVLIFAAVYVTLGQISTANTQNVPNLNIISRTEWGARSPKKQIPNLAKNSVSHVIIHHSASPSCETQAICQTEVRGIQNYHMDSRNWIDIAYNFLVGEDGNVYEGRGWHKKGAHSKLYNGKSIGICIIGNYENRTPKPAAIEAVKRLISYGVANNKIKSDYVLLGHRQTWQTACPGNSLYEMIKSWPHWQLSSV